MPVPRFMMANGCDEVAELSRFRARTQWLRAQPRLPRRSYRLLHDGGGLLVFADARHPFLELRRGMSFPEARGWRVVTVYVDDFDLIRGVARSHDVCGLLVGSRNKMISGPRFA